MVSAQVLAGAAPIPYAFVNTVTDGTGMTVLVAQQAPTVLEGDCTGNCTGFSVVTGDCTGACTGVTVQGDCTGQCGPVPTAGNNGNGDNGGSNAGGNNADVLASVTTLPETGSGMPGHGNEDLLVLFSAIMLLGAAAWQLRKRAA